MARAKTIATIDDLKLDPLATVVAGKGAAVAILSEGEPVFYCVPAQALHDLLDRVEDLELHAIVDARLGQPIHRVTLDDF
jgi:antitoxin StbD